MFAPLIGLAVGAVMVAVVWLASRLFYGLSLVVATLLVFAIAIFTRMKFADGLMRVGDAWFASKGSRLAELARDGARGEGVAVVALMTVVYAAALPEFAFAQMAGLVVLAPVFGRMAAIFSATLGKPAKPDEPPAEKLDMVGWMVALLTLGVTVVLPPLLGVETRLALACAGFALLAALAVPHLIAQRFGGVTRETSAASVLVTEVAVLVGALAITSVMRMVGWTA